MLMIVICLLMEKKSLNLTLTIKMLTFQLKFFLGSICNGFSATEFREVSLNGNVYDFSVDYNSIDILNIHNYLMTNNNINNVQSVYCIVKL